MATATQHNAWASKKGEPPRLTFLFDADVAADTDTGWMQCGVEGEWAGHPEGKFRLDAKLFDALIARFEANGRPVATDWRHLSESGIATKEAGLASGWIIKLERRSDEQGRATLWARVDWVAEAAAAIRDKTYRFCSPSIGWKVPDARTGKEAPELTSVALTNKPFLAGMQPLQLSRGDLMAEEVATEDNKEKPVTMSFMDKVAEKRGQTVAEIEAWFAENFDKIMALMGDSAAAEPASVSASADVLMLAGEIRKLSSEVTALKATETQRATKNLEAEIDGYITSGRISMGMRDLAIRTFSNDRALAEKTWPKGTKMVPVGDMQAESNATSADKPSASKVNLSALDVTPRQFRDEMVSQREYFDRLRHGGYSEQEAFDRAIKRIPAA